VNGNYVTNFDGWTAAESVPLLSFLYADSCKPEYTWRHRWEPGDLVIWDNRCTQHMVINDVGGQERTLHRINIRGDVPV
jgi:taurine dioxygenase